MSTHTLDVSRDGIVRTLRDQFTSRLTFLAELLQNARRAGATAVRIEWDARTHTLTVEDDGAGIADFAAVFTIGRSDWSPEVLERENPFGIGLMAAILASSAIEIHSLASCVRFTSASLLEFNPITVERAPMHIGARLKLTLNEELRAAGIDWHSVLERLVRGFPLPVFFEGAALPRPDALDGGRVFRDCALGRIALRGDEECDPISPGTVPLLYFQGLPVRVTTTRMQDVDSVLHLDAAGFRVRVPDRDVLVDEGSQIERIRTAILTIWQKRLRERYASLPRSEFVERHWRLCTELGCESLIADAPLVPSMIRQFARAMPVNPDTRGEYELYMPWPKGKLPGRQALFFDSDNVSFCGLGDDWQGPLASVYAIKSAMPNLHEQVPGSHWARKREVNFADVDVRVEYELIGESRSMRFVGYFGECELCACDRYVIRCVAGRAGKLNAKTLARLAPIEVDDITFFDPLNERLVIPSKSVYPESAIDQIFSYFDGDDRFLEVEIDEDSIQLARVIASLRSGSSVAYVNSLLATLWVDPEHVKDRSFCVRFDPKSARLVAENP